MEAGSYAKWQGEDFAYKGQIVSIKDGRVLLNTEHGLMEFPEDDGNLSASRKVAGLDEIKAKVARVSSRRRAAKPGSKKARAIELYAASSELIADLDDREQRAAIIKMFVDTLDMTPAGASTYYAMAKRAA